MAKPSEAMQCRVVGRIAKAPEATTTAGGVRVCRLVVVKEADGPASSPVRVGLYTKGDLARRCAGNLREGDLIEGLGELAARRGASSARYPEILVPDAPENMKLYERAGATA
jgi:hypothetical protein